MCRAVPGPQCPSVQQQTQEGSPFANFYLMIIYSSTTTQICPPEPLFASMDDGHHGPLHIALTACSPLMVLGAVLPANQNKPVIQTPPHPHPPLLLAPLQIAPSCPIHVPCSGSVCEPVLAWIQLYDSGPRGGSVLGPRPSLAPLILTITARYVSLIMHNSGKPRP